MTLRTTLKTPLIAGFLACVMALALSACAAEAEPDPVGEWGAQTRETPHLAFTDDGKVSGSDGCNQLAGTWKAEGSKVTFGQMASTLAGCMDVDTWLLALDTAEIDGDTLTVFDEHGQEIGTLKRQ